MKKVFLFTFSFVLLFSTEIHGQMCGIGTFTIKVSSKEKARYTLFPITPRGTTQGEDFVDWLEKTFSPDEKLKYRSRYSIQLEVKSKFAKKFLKKYKAENYEGFDNRLMSNKASAISRNGIIQFISGENILELYLLKISSAGKTKYFIDNFLGGCRSKREVDL